MKKNIFQKIWPIIIKNKLLRTLSLLNIIFISMILIFLLFSFSYSQQNKMLEDVNKQNKQTLLSLERLVNVLKNKKEVDTKLININKSFTGNEEVIPFITYLEGIFFKTDPKALISINSQESQILKNHYADYKISLKIDQKQSFFDAFDKLFESRYITKLIDFSIFYNPPNKNVKSELSRVEFIIRLFLK